MLSNKQHIQATALIFGNIFAWFQLVNGFVGRELLQEQLHHNATSKLIQLYHSNEIRFAYMLIKENTVDASQHFIQSIAEIEHPAGAFQWQIMRLQPTLAGHELLPNFTATRLELAHSIHEWVFVFDDRLEFGREEYELCMASVIRDFHHLSLVLVVIAKTQETSFDKQSIIYHLQYVWEHVHPTDLFAIVCEHIDVHSECVSYKYNPEMITRNASTHADTQSLFEPSNHAAASRLQRPLHIGPNHFVVKLILTTINTFVVFDLAQDGKERLVGYNVLIAKLLADMLHKPLHLVLITMDTPIDERKLHNTIGEQDLRILSKSLLAEDRIAFTATYAESLEEYKRYTGFEILIFVVKN